MCHVEMLGVKNLISLSINDQLTEKLGLLDLIIIKKNTGISAPKLNRKKSKNKIVSTLQENCQAFGLIVEKSLSPEEDSHKRYFFEITLLKNQKHYIQFHKKMLYGLLTVWF